MLLHSSRFYTCHWDSRMAVLRVTSSHSLPLLTSAIWFLFLHIWGLQPKSSPRKLLLLFQSLTSLVCESLGPQSPSSNLILRLPSWVLQVIAPSVMIGYWLWSFYFLHLQHGYSTQLCEVIRSCFTLVFYTITFHQDHEQTFCFHLWLEQVISSLSDQTLSLMTLDLGYTNSCQNKSLQLTIYTFSIYILGMVPVFNKTYFVHKIILQRLVMPTLKEFQAREVGNYFFSGFCPVLSSSEYDAEEETGLKALAVVAGALALMLQWGATSWPSF